MLKISKIVAFNFFIVASITLGASAFGQVQNISPRDVHEFGTSLVRQTVQLERVVIRDAYACKLESNLGFQCLNAALPNATQLHSLNSTDLVIKSNLYTIEQYRRWMRSGRLVTIIGTIEMRDTGVNGDYSVSRPAPTFVAYKIIEVN